MTLESKEIITTKVTYIAKGKEYLCELEILPEYANVDSYRVKKLVVDNYIHRFKLAQDVPQGLTKEQETQYLFENNEINIQTVDII
ncbi:TPA: hypothetical protein ACX6R8_001330 [Photobacterium damselae]